ncbi:hypothetical protein CRUP_012324 [Coryphaenoides rupestris]|nr:hypothetical protein CRUP_012324 [Coryphaenoides rupestris]
MYLDSGEANPCEIVQKYTKPMYARLRKTEETALKWTAVDQENLESLQKAIKDAVRLQPRDHTTRLETVVDIDENDAVVAMLSPSKVLATSTRWVQSMGLSLLEDGDLSASDTSLVELVERQRRPLPQELMPLPPSSNRDSPMDWTHLVDVANTFEGESICADEGRRRGTPRVVGERGTVEQLKSTSDASACSDAVSLRRGGGRWPRPPSHRRSLQRTLSDESIYRGQRPPPLLSDTASEQALASDVLFSCSTVPRSPTTRGVPLRRPSYKLGVKLHEAPVAKSGPGYSGAPRIQRQEQVIHLSPKKGSQRPPVAAHAAGDDAATAAAPPLSRRSADSVLPTVLPRLTARLGVCGWGEALSDCWGLLDVRCHLLLLLRKGNLYSKEPPPPPLSLLPL